MEIVLVIGIIIIMALVCVYIFKHGVKDGEAGSENCMRGCMSCGASEFCNDIKRFSDIADRK